MNPHQRNEFISWTALGLLAHDVCAFQMPEGTSFYFILREALEESDAPFTFKIGEDPDKIIENSIIHPRYEIWDARWDELRDHNRKWCFEVHFVATGDREAFESGESGLNLVAQIRGVEPEDLKETDLYRFGGIIIQKLITNGCAIYRNK